MNFPRGTELIILLILLILVFGWKRLPDAARSLGRSARVFKSEVDEMKKDGKDADSTATRADTFDESNRSQQQASPPLLENPDAEQPDPQVQSRSEGYRLERQHPDDPNRPTL